MNAYKRKNQTFFRRFIPWPKYDDNSIQRNSILRDIGFINVIREWVEVQNIFYKGPFKDLTGLVTSPAPKQKSGPFPWFSFPLFLISLLSLSSLFQEFLSLNSAKQFHLKLPLLDVLHMDGRTETWTHIRTDTPSYRGLKTKPSVYHQYPEPFDDLDNATKSFYIEHCGEEAAVDCYIVNWRLTTLREYKESLGMNSSSEELSQTVFKSGT